MPNREDILIRPMEERDRPAVLAMMEVFYASNAVATNGSAEIFQRDLDACLSPSPYLEGFCFTDGSKAVGYAMLAKSFSTEYGKPCIWIEDLYLTPAYRNRGLGKGFFALLESRYPGCLLRLEAEEDNVLAVHVYRRSGFQSLPYLELAKEQ